MRRAAATLRRVASYAAGAATPSRPLPARSVHVPGTADALPWAAVAAGAAVVACMALPSPFSAESAASHAHPARTASPAHAASHDRHMPPSTWSSTRDLLSSLLSLVLPSPVSCDSAPPPRPSLLEDDTLAPSSTSSGAESTLSSPGDWDDLNRSRGMDVDVMNGIMIVFASSIGHEPVERASVTSQLQFEADGRQAATFILEDGRSPSFQAMVQVAPEGNAVILHGGQALAPRTNLTGDLVLSVGGGLIRRVVTLKHHGDDYFASVSVKGGRESALDLKYHQMLHPQLSMGGVVSAPLEDYLLFPIPAAPPKDVLWALQGAWHSAKGETSLLAALDAVNGNVSARWWRSVPKNLTLGAEVNVKTSTLESSMQMGMNLGVGHDPLSGGPSSTVRAYLTSDLKVGMSVQHGTHSQFAPTQMLTVISCLMDHRAQDYQLGLQLQFMY